MRKVFISILLITVTALVTEAQGFTVRWAGGYAGQPGNSLTIPGPDINTQMPAVDKWTNLANLSDADRRSSLIHSSYGKGFNIGLRFGYMINPYIAVDLGVLYTGSSKITANQTHALYYPDSTNVLANTGGYLSCMITTTSQNISLSPAVTLSYSKPKFKFYPYLRLGVTLPVWTQITHTTGIDLVGVSSSTPGIDSMPYFLGGHTDVVSSTTGAFTVGFNGALGVVWKAFPFVHFTLEINGQYMSIKGKTTTITTWNADGNDLLVERGAYRNQFSYVSKLNGSSNNVDYNTHYDPNKPKQDISPSFPYSNIGFNIGVQVFLNKKIFKDLDKYEETRKRKKGSKAPEPEPTDQPGNAPPPPPTPK